jgi:hypothetical protein
MSDLEVISLSLTAKYMPIDSENGLFERIDDTSIENLLERSQFNKRRKAPFGLNEIVRQKLALRFLKFEDCYLIDSMPLEICKFARHLRIKICKKDFSTLPAKGYCASQGSWYYGYKLHGVCSLSGVFHSLDITKANVHDIHMLKDVKHQIGDCMLLGDK